jgi:hypothetical protein
MAMRSLTLHRDQDAIRKRKQTEQREMLRERGLVSSVIKAACQIDRIVEQNPDGLTSEMSAMVSAIEKSASIRLRLINKFLPDMKAVEHVDRKTELTPEEAQQELMRVIADIRKRRSVIVDGEFAAVGDGDPAAGIAEV